MAADWVTFFGIMAVIAAGFVGIAFLCLQINRDTWVSHPLRGYVALRFLSEFLLPIRKSGPG